ncbi:peptidyl-prolyl cis-trans isomerase B [Cutibacterium avidum 44067]|nr:peptidyl-prolyl cis-trans isomerase B [Cutibacterium avidum 44067]
MRMTCRAATAVAVAGFSLLAGCSQTRGEVPGVSDSPDRWWTASPSTTSQPASTHEAQQSPAHAPAPTAPTPAAASGPCGYAVTGKAARPVDMPRSDEIERTGSATVTLTINDAPVVLTVDRATAPCAVNSFVSLAEQGFYNDASCHKLSTGDAKYLQCSDPSGTGNGGPGYSYPVEKGAKTGGSVGAGTLALVTDSQHRLGSQFALVYGDSKLPDSFVVIGSIDREGVDSISEIAGKGVAEDGSSPKVNTRIGSVVMG